MASARFSRWAAVVPRALAVTTLLSAMACGGVGAQALSDDATAKARFTITIARFVQRSVSAPTGDTAPLKICVLHNSPALGAAFAMLEGQRVATHPVNVLPNPRDYGGCGLLFIDNSAAHGSAAALSYAAGLPLLTLGTVDGFLSQGGMIELVNVNDTLRFDVNLKALRSSRLDLSSQVLELARHVRN